MARKLVFETPGLIDERAFTTMGLSAKPATESPIGYFGTGLKYAIAVLVRLGCEPVVWIGRDKYVFQKKQGKFRGVDYEGLRMRRERFSLTRATNVDLPFTTSYGRNWKPWMVFRELEANTRDENGVTLVFGDTAIEGVEGKTRIVVDHPKVVKAYDERRDIFLAEAVRGQSSGVQIIERPTNFIFWRGLRVYETSKPCLFTYNLLDRVELTEDRTLANEWYARTYIANAIAETCEDENIIKQVVEAGEDSWEYSLEFSEYRAPSRAFHNVMLNSKRANANALNYYVRWDERPKPPSTINVFEAHPLPWNVLNGLILDAKDTPVFIKPAGYRGDWMLVARKVVELINPKTPVDPDDRVEALLT